MSRPARGRRPGAPDTRAAILDAARELFAASGYAATSLRKVAATAGVDPALVHHYFDGKDGLFLAALALPLDPREVLAPVVAGGPDGAGERLLRVFFSVWDDEANRTPLLGLVRGTLEPGGPQLLRDGFLRLVLLPVLTGLGVDQPERRAGLVATQMVGLVMVRYVIEVEPVASAPADELVPVIGAVVQGYLTGDLP